MRDMFIADCNRLIREYNGRKREQYPHWNDFVLLPLVREIGTRLNMQYDVSGVYGLRYVSYIKVFDDENSYILSVIPKFAATEQAVIDYALKTSGRNCMNEIECLRYDTGEDTKPWDLNGFGCVTQILPDDIDEIIEIMRLTGR